MVEIIMCAYWDGRFGHEGKIWGMTPSATAMFACERFRRQDVRSVLVPGAGYGRNALLFARTGFAVTGVEISAEAVKLAEGTGINFVQGSFLDVPVTPRSFDAVYCYNVLHLFLEGDRKRFVAKCADSLRDGGLAFFAVFSDDEASCGKGPMIEPGTYESKPGRPVHYFSEKDLIDHFSGFEVLETGVTEDPEEHGEEGKHVHLVRYILARKRKAHEFNGVLYRAASGHQREWGERLIAGLGLRGDERILDLGCGDGTVTSLLAAKVPGGRVLGIDASAGMIGAAKPLESGNLRFETLDIADMRYVNEFDLIFSNAALHWVRDHRRLLAAAYAALADGGRIRFNFAGDGNCRGFLAAVKDTMTEAAYSHYFAGFEWPWYMPEADVYRQLVEKAGFREVTVEQENADRTFSESELIAWIDQPSIVPFLERVAEPDKRAFRDEVVRRTMKATAKGDGAFFETFRRISVSARR